MNPPHFATLVFRVAGLALAGLLVLDASGLARLPLAAPTGGFVAIGIGLLLVRCGFAAGLPAQPQRGFLGVVLAVVGVGVWLYRDLAFAPYLADDLFFALEFAPGRGDVVGWWLPRHTSGVQILRPLSHTLTWVQLGLFGPDPRVQHLVNLALHLGAAVTAGWIATRVTGRLDAGALAGLGFVLHPLTVPVACWIATHQDPLALLFALGSLAALLEGPGRWQAVSLMLLGCAVLSKESVLVVPVALVVTAGWLFADARTPAGLVRRVGPHLLLIGLYFGFRLTVFGGIGGYHAGDEATVLHLNPGVLRTFGTRVPELLLMAGSEAIFGGVARLRGAAGALAVLALTLAVGGRTRIHGALIAIGGALLIAGLIPVHNMAWVGPHLLNARYLYVATAGFVLLLTGVLTGCIGGGDADDGLVATDRIRRAVGWLLVVVVLGGQALLAVGNREQWLANASIPGGIGQDLAATRQPVTAVELIDFPPVWLGSYIFHLELLPRLVLGRELPVTELPVTVLSGMAGDDTVGPVPAGVARYRFLGDERLWRRER